MTDKEHNLAHPSPLRRRICGSALSALIGWFTLNLIIFVYAFFTRAVPRSSHPTPTEWLDGPFFVALFSAFFVFPTWLFVLLPLYLFVPLRSFVWRWPICTLCGALAGALIMLMFYRLSSQETARTVIVLLAALTGGVSCLFGALTVEHFHYGSHATNVA